VTGAVPEGCPFRPRQGAGPGVSPAGDELGHGPCEGHGAVVPAGDNGKGGLTTTSVGNREERSSSGVEVGVVVVKGKIDSSNTTWREMRTRREVRSKHR